LRLIATGKPFLTSHIEAMPSHIETGLIAFSRRSYDQKNKKEKKLAYYADLRYSGGK
jgi:hypothetical protein